MTILAHSGVRTTALADGLIDSMQRYGANWLGRLPRVYAGGPEFERLLVDVRRRDGEQASLRCVEFFGRLASLILAGASPRYDASLLRGYIAALAPRAL